MYEIILRLGSNMGCREDYLNSALKRLSAISETTPVCSSLYESEPWGFDTETWFLNMAVKINSTLTPIDLLQDIMKIEKELGRVRNQSSEGYDSRVIDIDIIYYGSLQINTDFLIIPHPKMQQRRFVLMPVAEISPDFIHPQLNKTSIELLQECEDKSIVIVK